MPFTTRAYRSLANQDQNFWALGGDLASTTFGVPTADASELCTPVEPRAVPGGLVASGGAYMP